MPIYVTLTDLGTGKDVYCLVDSLRYVRPFVDDSGELHSVLPTYTPYDEPLLVEETPFDVIKAVVKAQLEAQAIDLEAHN